MSTLLLILPVLPRCSIAYDFSLRIFLVKFRLAKASSLMHFDKCASCSHFAILFSIFVVLLY